MVKGRIIDILIKQLPTLYITAAFVRCARGFARSCLLTKVLTAFLSVMYLLSLVPTHTTTHSRNRYA